MHSLLVYCVFVVADMYCCHSLAARLCMCVLVPARKRNTCMAYKMMIYFIFILQHVVALKCRCTWRLWKSETLCSHLNGGVCMCGDLQIAINMGV